MRLKTLSPLPPQHPLPIHVTTLQLLADGTEGPPTTTAFRKVLRSSQAYTLERPALPCSANTPVVGPSAAPPAGGSARIRAAGADICLNSRRHLSFPVWPQSRSTPDSSTWRMHGTHRPCLSLNALNCCLALWPCETAGEHSSVPEAGAVILHEILGNNGSADSARN